MNANNLGSIVRYHRKRAGLSQKECALLAGIGKTAMFDIEKGKDSVRLSTVMAVLSVLNISVILESPLMEEFNAQRHH